VLSRDKIKKKIQGGEMTQALYAHMSNKIIKKNI
jgi:hypothetical protein